MITGTEATTQTTGLSSGSDTQTRTSKSELGKDDFLNLLVTQLRYQDPLKPMEDKEFIAQMAQFTSLEQMQNLNKSMSSIQAAGMIGRTIKAEVSGENGTELVYGTVISSKEINGEIYLNLDNGRQIKATDATTTFSGEGLWKEAQSLVGKSLYVRDSTDVNGDTDNVYQMSVAGIKQIVDTAGNSAIKLLPSSSYKTVTGNLTDAQALVGKKVYIKQYDEDGKETDVLVQVKVTGAEVENNTVKLKYGSGDSEETFEFKDIMNIDDAIELKDIWNIVPDAEDVSQ